MHRRPFLISLVITACFANPPTSSLSDLAASEYDFVIIGAGTAGSVLASRLSEDPSVTVLVIEAGINNAGVLDVQVPFLGVTLPETSVDWNFTTIPEVGLNNRSIELPRGFVLGGSSSINLLAWNRGSEDYWNSFAADSGDSGWSFDSVAKYYFKTSTLVPPADGHNTVGEVDPTAYGHGPVNVSLGGFPTELDSKVKNSAKMLNGRFSYIEDFNKGNMLGFGFVVSSIGHGSRSSAATSYLQSIYDRPNVHILISTRVTSLVSSTEKPSRSKPHIDTVEVAQQANGPRTKFKASKEVLLCAGAMGTPHILMLSGIGPADTLKHMKIKPIAELADVGQHFADHPLVATYFSVNSNSTFDPVLRDPSVIVADLTQWEANRTGLFVDSPANTYGFMKLPPGLVDFDPSSGPHSPNTEIIFVNGFAPFGATPDPSSGSFLTLLNAVVSPTSRGSVTISSTDPFAPPLIDIGIFTTQFDILAMVQAIKDSDTFIKASPWKGYVIERFGAFANSTTDAQLAEFARNNAQTVNHASGTARISPDSASYGVVDSKLRVKGVSGLRVIDASVFPRIPECHPQAIVYTIAERAADLIKTAHGI